MQNFTLSIPTTLICGPGEFSRLGTETAAIGVKALLVTGRGSARKLGYTERAEKMLQEAGVEVLLFEKIEPNPRHTTCDEAAAIVRDKNIDVIVALGGGSAMDAAKAISAAAKSGKSCWDHCFHKNGFAKLEGALPIVAVPTTAATGSEADTAAVITNWETNEKCPLIDSLIVPKVAICDPELHMSVPAESTADGCVDIISHGFESYFNGDDDCTVQDRITEGLFNTVLEWGPVAFNDGNNLRARRELQYASTLILIGVANNGRGGYWPMHMIEHALSGHYDIAHGRGLAIVIPRYLRFVKSRITHRLAQFGERCFGISEGTQKSRADAAIAKLVEWLDSIGENLTLGDVGIDDEKFDVMINDVLENFGEDGVMANIVPLNHDSFKQILRMCQRPN